MLSDFKMRYIHYEDCGGAQRYGQGVGFKIVYLHRTVRELPLHVFRAISEQQAEYQGAQRKKEGVAQLVGKMVVGQLCKYREGQEHQEMRYLVGRYAEDELLHVRELVHVHEAEEGHGCKIEEEEYPRQEGLGSYHRACMS